MTRIHEAARLAATSVTILVLTLGCGTTHGNPPVSGGVVFQSPPPAVNTPPTPAGPADVARRVLLTWSRPDLPYGQWWAQLKPLLSPEGLQDYAYTDPSQVPHLVVVGEPVVQHSTVDTWTMVWLPTDHGRFGVRLSRTTAAAPWLAAEIVFPPARPAPPRTPRKRI